MTTTNALQLKLEYRIYIMRAKGFDRHIGITSIYYDMYSGIPASGLPRSAGVISYLEECREDDFTCYASDQLTVDTVCSSDDDILSWWYFFWDSDVFL